jgi:hypothetical protein
VTKATEASGMSLQEYAKKQTKSIESSVPEKEKVSETSETSKVKEDSVPASNKDSQVANSPKSITDIANLLKNKNIDKGDK